MRRSPQLEAPQPLPRRAPAGGPAALLAPLLVPFLVPFLVGACGHALGPGVAPSHPDGFDFRRPPCEPAPRPPEAGVPWRGAAPASGPGTAAGEAVVLRYLGAGGLYVGWRGEGLLVGPFFSNPDLLEVVFGRLRWRRGEIARGLRGVPTGRVGAILAGHSHYDHLGDVPFIARRFARRARLYLNQSGRNSLEPFPDLVERTTVLEEGQGRWVPLVDATGRPLPFRLRAVPSNHAPHFGPVTLWTGDAESKERPWTRRRYGALRAGQPFALVLDLLAAAEADAPVRFRILVHDSAADAGKAAGGIPPPDLEGVPYDLAMLCTASAHLVEAYPEALLEAIRPAHVLVTHYEDFFTARQRSRGFVPLLTAGRARAFLERVEGALRSGGQALRGPGREVCGPSAPGWTMPLPGEWMVFGPSRRSS